MQTSQLTIRIDKELKSKITAKAKKNGFNLSSLTRVFYTSFVNNDNIIKFDNESIIDEALKSKKVRVNLTKLTEAVIKRYPCQK